MTRRIELGPSPDHDACGVGFVARLGGEASHEVVSHALTALEGLSHRGGVDADGLSGDGAGVLLPIPEAFFRARASDLGVQLPETFGLGMAFLAPDSPARQAIEEAAGPCGLRVLGWRPVPTSSGVVGPRARTTLPEVWQCFLGPSGAGGDLERRLFLLRKRVEAESRAEIYFSSLSSRSVVYKGLLTPRQLAAFYDDLRHPEFTARFSIFHQRYSTNTKPSWKLAQPFRFLGHNGEINTLSGNRRWLRARARAVRRQLNVGDWFPVLEEGMSDSASLDDALELLLHQGYSVASALFRLIPPAWESDESIPAGIRELFEEQARQQEPWDGPAAVVFTDGRRVGAKLDRNGLRPLRFSLTKSGWLVAGSEAGLVEFPGERTVARGRLGPGEMLLANPAEGSFHQGASLWELVLRETPPFERPTTPIPPSRDEGRRPMARSRVLASAGGPAPALGPDRASLPAALGWTGDQMRLLFSSLPREGKEAIWSMGDDTPPAFLSAARRPLWDYFKQRFAQVTNPPIDPLRESHVMSLETGLGHLRLPSPVADAGQVAAMESELAPVARIDLTFAVEKGIGGGAEALERIAELARGTPGRSARLVVLSDRAVSRERAALPALLGVAAAWKALCEAEMADVPVVVESGQAIETHHLAMLLASGASAVFPYLALALAEDSQPGGGENYRRGVEAGLRKVLARMGISTLASYRNSQLFDIVGLDSQLAAKYFPDAPCLLGGRNLENILGETLERHALAFSSGSAGMADAGFYRFRQGGERHANAPELVRRLHRFVAEGGEDRYRRFAELGENREPVSVRDLLEILDGNPVPLDQVEGESGILRRFSTQAMSLGALGPEAHRTLAIAMNRLGARSNTGEGGEDPELYASNPEAVCRIKQVASARFGVTTEYLVRADELEIKMAQGSKPGEGGQLPAAKVTGEIARLRHAVPGMTLISPPPHHDIYSIEDLAELIHDLRSINPQARIGVKLVAGSGVGIIAAGVAKAGADVISISGYEGGTGASPLTSIKNTGLPWEVGLRETHAALIRAGFRGRVRVRVDGGLKFARDVIIAALLGADEFGFGTAALLAIGCVMARQCHLNTCPAGIATQEERLRLRFTGRPEMAMRYFRALASEVRERLAKLGARRMEEIVGEAGRLRPREGSARRLLGDLLAPVPESPFPAPEVERGARGIAEQVARLARPAERRQHQSHRTVFPVRNADRAVGARLSGELLRRGFDPALEPAPLVCRFRGIAGQSFGAFLIRGLVFRMEGEANDYVGKGLSGGTIALTAGAKASRRGDTIAGNTALYGATSGELYVAGRAGERFAVRNSGALAVVEGIGQHGCEYMTAGVVVLLGPSGRNLGSGMTGGLAYQLSSAFSERNVHPEFVRPAAIDAEEDAWLRLVLRRHYRLTGSPRAAALLRAPELLPLVRLEPVRLPCTIRDTWAPILPRLERILAAPAVARPDPAEETAAAELAPESL